MYQITEKNLIYIAKRKEQAKTVSAFYCWLLNIKLEHNSSQMLCIFIVDSWSTTC